MTAHAVTLQLSSSLYDHFRRRAEVGRRSLEAEILKVVQTAAGQREERLPRQLAEELAELASFDDDALWRAGRSHLPGEASAQLEALNAKQKNEGLSGEERDTLAQLLYQYERYMLVRAQAAKLLKERGYDVSRLLSRE